MEDARARAELERIAFGREADEAARAQALRQLHALQLRAASSGGADAGGLPVDPLAESVPAATDSAASDAATDAVGADTTRADADPATETGALATVRRLPRALLVGAALLALVVGVGVGWAARGGGGGGDGQAAGPTPSAVSSSASIDVDAQSVVLRCFTQPGTAVAASVVFADYTAASDAYRDPPGACTDLIPQSIDRMAIADRIRTVVDAGASCGSIAQMEATGEDVTYFAADGGTTRISHDPALISGLRCDTEIVLNADPPTFQRSITCRSAQGVDVVGGTSDFGDCPSP